MKSRFITTASSLLFAAHMMLLPGVFSQSNAGGSCFTNLTLISDAELAVEDLSVARKYILCANTKFVPSLTLRSNATVMCGDDGSSANSCVIEQGDPVANGTLVAISIGTSEVAVTNDTVVENVVVQGVTVDFISASLEPAVIPVIVGLRRGDVTFKDCIFSNLQGEPMFLLSQYVYDGNAPEPVSFTFDSCRFEANFPPLAPMLDEGLSLLRFAALDPFQGLPFEGTIDATVVNNVFIGNDFSIKNDDVLYRSMIAFSSTGELRLEDNCFINSPVSPFNASSVVVLFNKPTVKSVNNFLDVVQTELPCPYMLDINNDYSVTCRAGVVFNASTCASDPSYTLTPATTDAPTPPPANTDAPTPPPATAAPTVKTSAASTPYSNMSFFGVSALLSTSFAFTALVTIMFASETMML